MAEMVMCVACGHFVSALEDDGGDLRPVEGTCPRCGGTEFKDNETDRVVDTRDE